MANEIEDTYKDLRVVVAAVDPKTREVEEVVLTVVSITRNEDGTPSAIWADVDDGQAINVCVWAWRYCLISLDFDDQTLMEILTLWHREIDREMSGVDDLTQLGLNVENLIRTSEHDSTSVEGAAGAAYA